jgi:hypothetical protein
LAVLRRLRNLRPFNAVKSKQMQSQSPDVAGLTDVEVDDFSICIPELMCRVDGAVTSAPSGNQDSESFAVVLCPCEAVVVDHRQVIEPGPLQTVTFVTRFPRRIWQVFIVLAHDLIRSILRMLVCHEVHAKWWRMVRPLCGCESDC